MAHKLSHLHSFIERRETLPNANNNESFDSSNSSVLQKFQGRLKPRPVYGLHKRLNNDESSDQNIKIVMEKYKTYTFDKSFTYNYLDTRLLKSIFLDENKYFKDCIFLINEYNDEALKARKSKDEFKNGPWKMRFFSTLYNLLREVIFTKDRVLQRSFAQEVNQWAYQQLEALEADQKEVKPFDGDPAFMLSTIRGIQRDFSRYYKTSYSRERPGKSLDKQKTVNFTLNTLPNFNDESSIMVNRTFLDESTRDQTGYDPKQSSPQKDDSILSQSSSHFKVNSILSQAGVKPRMKQPSEYIVEALQDYNICARTKHPEYEPPSIRLKEYKRRVLSFDDPSKILSKIQVNPEKEESEFARVTYPKPQTLQDLKKKKEEEEQAALEEQKKLEAQKLAAEGVVAADGENKDNNVASVDGQEQTGEQKVDEQQSQKDIDITGMIEKQNEEQQPKKPPLQPNIKNFTHDEFGKETFVRDLSKKFDTRSKYIFYEPTDDVREVRMENKWLEGRQKELKEKRENEEMIKMSQEWSLAKGRIEKEINRKIDSNIYGSRYRECEYRFQKKNSEQLHKLDVETKEAALRQNALEEIKEIEDKKKRIELKKKEREERRKEREEKKLRKKKYDDDSDKEGNKSDEDSYDEELDGPFDPTNPKFQNKKRFHSLHSASQKPVQKSVDFTSALPKIAKSQNQTNQIPFKGLEYDTQRQKIEMIKKLHGNLIGIKVGSNGAVANGQTKPQSSTQPINQVEYTQSSQQDSVYNNQENEPPQPTLSVYSRDILQKLRPFSAIFESQNLSHIQSEQLAEVQEVKNRMAKYKLSVPYKRLQTAIIVPEGLLNQQDLEEIPNPGQGLIRNPFMKDKKKKKKKKKKRK